MEYDRADKEVAEMSKIKVNEQRAVDEFQELTAIDAPSFNLHVGADADMTNKITVNIDDIIKNTFFVTIRY